MDRFNQMSGQANLIARKKVEIEAKLKAQQEAAQNSGSVSLYNQLAGSAKGSVPPNTTPISQRQQKALPIGNLKNRWGFKGKSTAGSESEKASGTSTDSTGIQNTFSNDGSFLEQFKKTQHTTDINPAKVRSSEERTDNSLRSQPKQGSQHSSYATSSSNKSHKDILSTPPPPPPISMDIKKYEITDIANKPKEADEWYKQALERARNIAKNLGQSSNTSSVPNQDASNPKLTDNAIPSKIYNKQEVKHEPGLRPDFSVPPPPIRSSVLHQPPPSMTPEYGQEPNPLGYSQVQSGNLGEEFGNDNDSSGNTLYSPTKPTVTPTKIEMSVRESPKNENKVADGHIKVLLAECKFQPPPELQSKSSVAYDLDRQSCIINADSDDLKDIVLSTVAEELASMVACTGDQLENIARNHNAGLDEQEMSFLYDTAGKLYQKYRQRVESLRKGIAMESNVRKREAEEKAIEEIDGTSGTSEAKESKKRKRRWGDENDKVNLEAPVLLPTPGILPSGPLKNVGRCNPELIQYAIRVFGTTDLTESQWKQCEDQIKMSMVYNEMLTKKKQLERLAQKGKNKYEYDSDEDIEGGTWEHKARKLEMQKTNDQATKQTDAGQGMHHIGDFLPPDELTKFMNKFKALQNGEEYDDSDYVEKKLTSENLGFKMLERMGWSEGKGLGQEGGGITAPVGKSGTGADKKGLGVSEVHNLEEGDDEFEAYRKRMMMAYRFRPNPLNNPRRAYY